MMSDFVLAQTPWLPNSFVDKLYAELGLNLRDMQWPSVSWSPLDSPNAQEAMLFGSDSARARRCLTQADLDWFLNDAPQGYGMVGFWGYGVNSYAFYYARVDAWSRVYFRLPYGGVYMDNAQASMQIGLFVRALFEFERRVRLASSRWIAVEAGEHSRYERVSGAKYWSIEESILHHEDPLMTLESTML
jgi:hypothetical protein